MAQLLFGTETKIFIYYGLFGIFGCPIFCFFGGFFKQILLTSVIAVALSIFIPWQEILQSLMI